MAIIKQNAVKYQYQYHSKNSQYFDASSSVFSPILRKNPTNQEKRAKTDLTIQKKVLPLHSLFKRRNTS